MSSIPFEEVYANAYVRDSVHSIMDSLVRQYPMLKRHEDDVRQQLWLILNRQLPKFNPAKCSIETYARMTLDSAVKEVRRSYLSPRNRKKHSILQMSIPLDDDDCGSAMWMDEKTERERFFATIREAVALLPPLEREICRLLAEGDCIDGVRIKLKIGYETLTVKYIPRIKRVLAENIF